VADTDADGALRRTSGAHQLHEAPDEIAPAPTGQSRRVIVMISGLVSVSGLRSQSPNCSTIVRPASVRNEVSDAASRNRSVLRLVSGRSQLGWVKWSSLVGAENSFAALTRGFSA